MWSAENKCRRSSHVRSRDPLLEKENSPWRNTGGSRDEKKSLPRRDVGRDVSAYARVSVAGGRLRWQLVFNCLQPLQHSPWNDPPRLREKDTQSKRRYGTKTHFPSYHYFIAAINLALLFGAMKVKPPCSLAYLYC